MPMAEVIPFVKHEFTMNCDTGDGFTCMACGHWVVHANETEWGDLHVVRPKRFGHVHGTEPFRFCPHCGARVLSLREWADVFPGDMGKTLGQIERERFVGRADG